MTEPALSRLLRRAVSKHLCPECRNEMEMTQVYESLGDFYSDGPYHWEWTCKCGHKEKVKT